MMQYKILLVEDDVMILSGLVYTLEMEGYLVTPCENVQIAKEAIANQDFHLAILDMQLPDGTGFDVRNALKGKNTSIIFLTAVDDEGNIVKAFEEGADDYITKPFRLRELLARVKRSLQAREGGVHANVLQLGRVSIDILAGKVVIDGQVLELTALEYRLLLTFASHLGQTLSRTQILDNIWDSAGNFVEDNTLTVYIKRLREKLGDAVVIETVKGVGYRVD